MKRVVRSLRSLTPRGFTLPEVLVTVAIIAVLASAVVPTVVNQISKGDTPALQADLNSVRQAITSFTTDVRAYPRSLSALDSSAHVNTDSASLCGSKYGGTASNWKGPYLASKTALQTTSDGSSAGRFITSAYSISFNDVLEIPTGTGEIAVSVRDTAGNALSQGDVDKLKSAIDGTTASYSGTGNGNSGLVRFTSSGSNFYATNPVYILLVPIGKC